MGMLLMLTFVAMILLGYYAISAGEFGIIGGAVIVFMTFAIPIGIPSIAAFFLAGEKPKKERQYINPNENISNILEETKLKVNYGKLIHCQDKIFIFGITENNERLASSYVHCFDFKKYERDYSYKKTSFSRVVACEKYENGIMSDFSYKKDFNKPDNASCENGIVLYYDISNSRKNECVVFEFNDKINDVFEVIKYIIENHKKWNYKTSWSDILNIPIFENIKNK